MNAGISKLAFMNAIRILKLALAVAIVFALLGRIRASFVENKHISPLMQSVAMGGLAFVATIALAIRDLQKLSTQKGLVRQHLENRPDMDERTFSAEYEVMSTQLAVFVRAAVAEFFMVPVEKIRPDDSLELDYQFQRVMTDFQVFIVSRVLREYHLSPAVYRFDSRNLANFTDLVNEVGRIISNCQ
jgi:hypothetical protein